MKLSVGMRVVRERERWRVVLITGSDVHIRRLEYRLSLDGRGPMAFCDTDTVLRVHRGNFELLYSLDEQRFPGDPP